VLPRRAALAWLALQSAAASAIFWALDGWQTGLSAGVGLAGIQGFTFTRGLLAKAEREAREALARVEAERSRAAERLRISRDLHDTLGHHLTALSLQLDVAARRSQGAAAEHIREAHAVTRLLLSDVRDVVGQLRDGASIDVVEAIRPLVEDAGDLHVHLDAPPALQLDSAARAHAVVRCVQEVVTNARRHAGARNVWIRISAGEDGLELDARDDGRGAETVECGHGLNGMRERFEEHGGRAEFRAAPGRGFEVRAFLPNAAEPGS
jgi:signal transduction histidine kinase